VALVFYALQMVPEKGKMEKGDWMDQLFSQLPIGEKGEPACNIPWTKIDPEDLRAMARHFLNAASEMEQALEILERMAPNRGDRSE
jgi:hypothetical protein